MVKRKLDPGQKIKLKLFAQTHNASKESKVVLELRVCWHQTSQSSVNFYNQ